MPDGGFLIKYDGKEAFRCHAIAFDFDLWQCSVNNAEKKPMPERLSKIEIELE